MKGIWKGEEVDVRELHGSCYSWRMFYRPTTPPPQSLNVHDDAFFINFTLLPQIAQILSNRLFDYFQKSSLPQVDACPSTAQGLDIRFRPRTSHLIFQCFVCIFRNRKNTQQLIFQHRRKINKKSVFLTYLLQYLSDRVAHHQLL